MGLVLVLSFLEWSRHHTEHPNSKASSESLSLPTLMQYTPHPQSSKMGDHGGPEIAVGSVES